MAHHNSPLSFKIDLSDPDFAREFRLWATETQSQMHELFSTAAETIYRSRALMAEIDRMLAQRMNHL
jgi:hypothetical protein